MPDGEIRLLNERIDNIHRNIGSIEKIYEKLDGKLDELSRSVTELATAQRGCGIHEIMDERKDRKSTNYEKLLNLIGWLSVAALQIYVVWGKK